MTHPAIMSKKKFKGNSKAILVYMDVANRNDISQTSIDNICF